MLMAVIALGIFTLSYYSFSSIGYFYSRGSSWQGPGSREASSASPDIRLTGAMAKRAQDPLLDAARIFIDLTEFPDRTLRRYDPVNFQLERHYRAIMRSLLLDENDADPT